MAAGIRADGLGGGAILLLASLSTAGIVLLAPVWLLRAIAVRDRRDAIILSGPLLGVLAQLPSLLTRPVNFFDSPRWSFGLFPAYAQRVLGGGLLGNNLAGHAWRSVGVPFEVLMGAGFAVAIVAAVLGLTPRAKFLVAGAAVLSVASFLISGYERGLVTFLLWPRGQANAANARYVVFPTLLLVAAACIALDDRLSRSAAPRRSVPAVGAVALVVGLALTSFTPVDHAFRGRPTWSSSVARARRRCTRSPLGSVVLPVSPFGSVEIACHRLA